MNEREKFLKILKNEGELTSGDNKILRKHKAFFVLELEKERTNLSKLEAGGQKPDPKDLSRIAELEMIVNAFNSRVDKKKYNEKDLAAIQLVEYKLAADTTSLAEKIDYQRSRDVQEKRSSLPLLTKEEVSSSENVQGALGRLKLDYAGDLPRDFQTKLI